ncbi:MAG: TRAP transporter large permease subunit, partial [Dehalococcoidia bacterium]|nr:TRAP transporter large permease subunit [Dehalococcoidia bacterium]
AIILGSGMPTTAVYIIVALVAAPALVKMGLSLLQAHFFLFYFACLNFVTPPVAIGSLLAAKIAGANYLKTSFEAVKAALGGFAVPFLIIFCPVLILQPQPFLTAATGLLASLLGLVALQLTLTRQFLTRLDISRTAFFAATSVLLFSFLLHRNYFLLAAGVALFIILTLEQRRKRQRLAVTA